MAAASSAYPAPPMYHATTIRGPATAHTPGDALPKGFHLDREYNMLPSHDDRKQMKIMADVYAMLTTVDCLEDMFASGYVDKSKVSVRPRLGDFWRVPRLC